MIFKTGDRVVVGESKGSPGLCGREGVVIGHYAGVYYTVQFSFSDPSLWSDYRGTGLRHLSCTELSIARPPTPLEVQVRAYIDQELCR